MIALRGAVALLLPLLVGHAVLFPDEPKKGEADAMTPLLDQLSHPRFVRREEATRKLIELGEPVLERVRKHAQDHSENDVQVRCRQIVRGILKGCGPSKSTGMKLVLIDAGRFSMGSPANERFRRGDEPIHDVELTEPFLIGMYEVTQEEYQKVRGKNPSWFAPTGGGKGNIPVTTSSVRYPVESVTWFDAVAFCNALSEKDGFAPYYRITDPVEKDGKWIQATVTELGGNGYRLPTEAQWEFACRGQRVTPFHFGTRNTGREANTRPTPVTGYGEGPSFTAVNQPITVGNYPANDAGLFDLCGNIGEWCNDYYDRDYYLNAPAKNPPGPREGKHRVIRGGSWMVLEGSCRSASRHFATPDTAESSFGFRVVRQP